MIYVGTVYNDAAGKKDEHGTGITNNGANVDEPANSGPRSADFLGSTELKLENANGTNAMVKQEDAPNEVDTVPCDATHGIISDSAMVKEENVGAPNEIKSEKFERDE